MPFHTTTEDRIRQLAAEANVLVESFVSLVILKHGSKAPQSGPDDSWIIVNEPDAIEDTIRHYSRYGAPNLGAALAPVDLWSGASGVIDFRASKVSG